ncbi:MAG: hypothetical protein KC776_09785 [Myxococcales bacterium]|nr:hypothetical protein [Myxococcales bacterium]MCB9577155.1 hypothetical protein [Polyangiaceae bacterium]
MKRRHGLLLLAGALVACASTPRPRVLGDVDAVRTSPAAEEAGRLAPQAFARAELLRQRADQAHGDGETASSQILGEHALAAYGHAFVLARLAKAEERLASAKLELDKAQKELASLDEKQTRVSAEADGLEMQVKVAEDALPLVPNAPASAERERARLEAARALASQARLLCVATGLLGAQKDLAPELGKLDALDAELAKTPKATPIDEAVRARSACLTLLSHARKERTLAAPAAGAVDALLAELSQSGELHPFRDDRGIAVVTRGAFGNGGKLVDAGKQRFTVLGRVAKAHPDFPVLVVIHGGGAKTSLEDRARTVADTLKAAGATKVETQVVGSAQPVVDPNRAGAPARNERIEVVFVAPTS